MVDPDGMTKTTQDTQKAFDRLVEARERTRKRLDDVSERQTEIRTDLARLAVSDDEEDAAKALRSELHDLREEAQELEGVLPLIDERVEEARAALHRQAVEETFAQVRKVAGGLVGEHPRHVERAEEHERKAEESREKASDAATRSHRLRAAAEAVGRLLELDPGETKTVSHVRPPRRGPRWFLQSGKLRQAAREAVKHLDAEGLLSDTARQAIEARVEELSDVEEARCHQAQQQARRDEHAEERAQAQATVDLWLRDLLEDGPVPRKRAVAMARTEGFSVTRGEASLSSARRRLGVVPVEQIEDPGRPRASWWALPGTWREEEYRRIRDGGETPVSAVRF